MTTIGPSVTIRGDVSSTEDLRIEGRLTGRAMVGNATLVIGVDARLDADVHASNVRVLGTVKGNIRATARIELAETAEVRGSLSADHVVVRDGARFNGFLDMSRRTIAAKLAHFRESAAAQPQP